MNDLFPLAGGINAVDVARSGHSTNGKARFVAASIKIWASLFLLCAAGQAQAQLPAQRGMELENLACGKIYMDRYGPYDYRDERDKLKVVEEFHFSRNVEFLIKGITAHYGQDLNYTLLSSPNHHRALVAAVRYGERTGLDKPFGLTFSVECFFDRALRFRPDDTVARALYAQFLHKHNRTAEGLAQLDIAVPLAKDSAFSHYNLGLMYLELGQNEKALAQAHRANALGASLDGLERALKQQGKWRDPPQQ